MKSLVAPNPIAVFAALLLVLSPVFVSDALTPSERKMVQTIKTQVEEGQRAYDGALVDVRNAKKEASDANGTAAQTALDLKTAQDKFDAVNKDNARMKPVYDECTSYWGLGAIGYGIKSLLKHLLIAAAVIGGLILILYGLSFAWPIFGIILAIAVRVVRKGFSAVGAVFKRLTKALENHLKPNPASPLPVFAQPSPPPAVMTPPPLSAATPLPPSGPTGPTGATA